MLCPPGSEAFQPVDGQQVAVRIDEGHQLALDQIPVAGRPTEAWRAELLLPAGGRQQISCALPESSHPVLGGPGNQRGRPRAVRCSGPGRRSIHH